MSGVLVAAALVALCWASAPQMAAQGMGSIRGTVTTRVKPARPIRVTFDQKVCGYEVADPSVSVNASGGLANAVVTLTGVKAKAPSREVSVVNDKCAFVPRVQVVAPNGTVKTSSRDPVLHTTVVQQMDGRQLFNVALPMPGIEINKPLSGAGIMRVGCSTHQWMRGWIVATDEQSAVTAADGSFTLADVPPGTYQLRVWHEALKATMQTVTVAAGKIAEVRFEAR
jgi:plastocyanin